MSEGDSKLDSADDIDVAHCLSCMEEYAAGKPFCDKCGMPVGTVATLDPMQQADSTGRLYERASSTRHRLLVFGGMWFIFVPTALVTFWVLIKLMSGNPPIFSGDDRLRILWGLLAGGLHLAITCRVAKAYLRYSARAKNTCKKCGYNLALLPKPRCPECFTPFDPEESPGDLTRDANRDWVVPDMNNISEDKFPIDCAVCGADLAGLGDGGQCPKCAHPFDRRERLMELHGPEAFLPEKPVEVREPPREWFPRGAIILTTIALFAVPISNGLVDDGIISADRRGFVVFLFVAAAMEWVRAVRARQGEQESDDTTE